MFQKCKEILFGLAFGIGAVVIDTSMDAMADGNSFIDEMAEHPSMLLCRVVVVFGLVVGWLLWQNNRREREVRRVTEMLHKLQQECSTQGLLLRSSLPMLLMRADLHLTNVASRVLEETYARSQEYQRIAEQKSA